jgi:hypothetical protein
VAEKWNSTETFAIYEQENFHKNLELLAENVLI